MTLDTRLPLFSRACVEKIGETGDEAIILGYMNSLELTGGMEYWSGVLDWTTGVGGGA